MTDKTLFGTIFQFRLSYDGDCVTSQKSALHTEKSVPQKGTDRYKRAIQREKTRKRKEDISHVLKLLDSLHMQGKN